jgi:uncharacterized protein (DUF1778 family)
MNCLHSGAHARRMYAHWVYTFAMTTAQARINMRVSSDALEQIREAARLQGQDLTAFVLGSAMSTARHVLLEDRVLKLSPADALLVENALDSDEPAPQRLVAAFARQRAAGRTH